MAGDLFSELEPAARDMKIQRTRMERIEMSQAISLRRIAYALEAIEDHLQPVIITNDPIQGVSDGN